MPAGPRVGRLAGTDGARRWGRRRNLALPGGRACAGTGRSPAGRQHCRAAVTSRESARRWRARRMPTALRDGRSKMSISMATRTGRARLGRHGQRGGGVYRFDPASAGFRALQADTHGKDSCGDLMAERGRCHPHPHQQLPQRPDVWYTDQYRFAGAKLHLYRSESVLMLGDTLNARCIGNRPKSRARWRSGAPMTPPAVC